MRCTDDSVQGISEIAIHFQGGSDPGHHTFRPRLAGGSAEVTDLESFCGCYLSRESARLRLGCIFIGVNLSQQSLVGKNRHASCHRNAIRTDRLMP